MDRFAEIRPYNDNEVRQVLDNLVDDREFISTVGSLRFGRLNSYLPWLIRPIVRRVIKKETGTLYDIRSFQKLVTKYIARMIRNTTRGFEFSNLDRLDHNQHYLFISNHRDIALDPTFLNYALFCGGRDSARIAIGDNLLLKPFATDLMRLNKCFVVRRSVKGARQALDAYKTLSAYILHSIERDHVSIWIAQREGRAKDGNDFTEPAVIKMLAINRDRKKESLQGYIKKLFIVPVAISYEYDPCDKGKAKELYHRSEFGTYVKEKYEDLENIGFGISGYKGKVHVCFGDPLDNISNNPESIASELDRQIINKYVLHPTNLFAFQLLYGKDPGLQVGMKDFFADHEEEDKQRMVFEERINSMPSEYQKYALGIYANPILNKIKLID